MTFFGRGGRCRLRTPRRYWWQDALRWNRWAVLVPVVRRIWCTSIRSAPALRPSIAPWRISARWRESQSRHSSVRSLARGREFVFDGLRVLLTPYVPLSQGARPPRIITEGIRPALGIMCPLLRITQGAARTDTAAFRVFDATYGYLIKSLFVVGGAPAGFRNDRSPYREEPANI